MQEFKTALTAEVLAERKAEAEADPRQQPIHTKLDDRPLVLMPMTPGQMALAAFAISNGNGTDQVASIVNVFFGLLENATEIQHYKKRLWDRDDPFEPEIMVDIIKAAIAEWSGKATPPAGD